MLHMELPRWTYYQFREKCPFIETFYHFGTHATE